MSDQVASLQKLANEAAQAVPARTCRSCAHYSRSLSGGAGCEATGSYAGVARKHEDRCGHHARLWAPRPPSFWRRLGEAIIDRVRP